MGRPIRFNGVTLDQELLRNGDKEIPLAERELSVLTALLSHPNKILTEAELLSQNCATRGSLEQAVKFLRRGLAPKAHILETVQGQGYRLNARVSLPRELVQKLRTLVWIAYEPTDYDPNSNPPKVPFEDSIQEDLRVLKMSGFDGLITFRAEGRLAGIPSLARKAGFEGVIMGFRPDQKDIVKVAQENAEHVDSFCVGHNYEDLPLTLSRIEQVRLATNKPLTTTYFLSTWKDHEALAQKCDWLLLDVGVLWRQKHVSLDEQVADLKRKVSLAGQVANDHDTVVMLKMLSYPSAGIEGYTEAEQDEFHCKVRDFYGLPAYPFQASVFISWFSAFDILWKKPKNDYPRCEAHVGLFDSRRQPKKAASCFNSREMREQMQMKKLTH
jgi:DNA-binding winged helix-turn-helix (wHTH) protein